MEKGKKVARFITLIPVFTFVILEFLREFYWKEPVFIWIKIIFLVLVTIPALLGFMTISKGKKPNWMSDFSDLMPIYYGFVIMLIALNRDIVPQIDRWDVSMTGVGVAIIALGIFYLTQRKQEPLLEKLNKKIDKIEKTVRKLQPTKTRAKKQRK